MSSSPLRRPKPTEPVEGSAEDQLADDASVVDPPDDDPSDPDLDADAEPESERDRERRSRVRARAPLSAEESLYRKSRLGDPEIYARIARRFTKDLRSNPDVSKEDLLNGLAARALSAEVFPRAEEPIFPWIYRHANAEWKWMERHLQRSRTRTVPLDKAANIAARGPDELSDERQRQKDILDRATANDSGARAALDMYSAIAVDGESLDDLAPQRNISKPAYYKRVSRLFATVRATAAKHRVASALSMFIAIASGFESYEYQHGVRMDESHDVIPVGERSDPMPTPTVPTETILLVAAKKLREDGMRACAAGQWAACHDALDEAIADDPSLASDVELQKARERARIGLIGKAPPGP